MATTTRETPTVRAEGKYVRTAPRKAQLVAEQIRGRPVPEARTILAFMTRDAAKDVERVLASAVANAEANHGLIGDELYVSVATVGSGPTIKRWRARARGRVARIKKRTCHITIALAVPEGVEARAPVAAPTPPPAAEEETPKPSRAPRKKAETATEDAEAAPAKSAEKPKKSAAKPKPAAKPRAAKPKAAAAEEKPKARATKKTQTAKPKAARPKKKES
jgi:large subunit ribosomal protein L22